MASARLECLLLVIMVGALILVLFAPFGSEFRAVYGLSLLLLLSLYLLHLHGEVSSLRSQLRVSGAMGWAGVHDPDSVDGSLLMQRFLELARELVPAERSLVWILNQGTGQLAPEFALPDRGPFARKGYTFGEGLIGHAAARMTPRVIAEPASGAWLLYSIVVHEQLLGVAQWTRSVRRPFSPKTLPDWTP